MHLTYMHVTYRYSKGDNSIVAAKVTGCFAELGQAMQLLVEDQTDESPGTATFVQGGTKLTLANMRPTALKENEIPGRDSIHAQVCWGYGELEDGDKKEPVFYVWARKSVLSLL